MTRVFAAMTVAALCHASNAFGAQSEPSQLSLDEALARAEAQSPIVRRARREREVVAAFRVSAAVLLPANPIISAAVGHRRDTSSSAPPSQGAEWSARIEQQVEIAGQRGTRMREAARALDVAEARERLARVETRARVRAAYIAALLTDAAVRYAVAREELGERMLISARARVQAGAASDVELNLAETERGLVTHQRIQSELAAAEAQGVLRLLLSLPVDARLTLTTQLGEPALSAYPLEQLLDQARLRREELKALESSRAQLDAQIVRLRREVVPSPILFLDVAQQQPSQLYLGGGLALPIPIWRRNQGELAIARAQREGIIEEKDLVANEVALEVSRAHRAALVRQKESVLWTGRIVPAAEANVDLVTQGWRAGKFDFFRVVVVAREAAEARRKQLEVLGELWQAAIDLDRATGMP